jgi:hypothetical protein
MTVTDQHSHSEQHRGIVPEDQLASGTPTVGYVATATGTGEAEWAAGGGGSSCDCCHEHNTERFVAAGDTPETFALSDPPLYGVRVYLGGLRADPDDVTVVDQDVSLDTSASDVVVVDYERECAAPVDGGDLVFPGVDETHDIFSTPTQMNVLGGFSTTGPAYVVIRGTDATDEFAVGTDDFPGTGLDAEGIFGPGFGNSPQAGDIYMFRLQNAAAYWIGGNFGSYSGGFTGSATYDIHYPAGGGTPLTFPGVTHAFAGQNFNLVATINVTGPTAMFVTFDAPLPTGYFVFVISDDETWQFFLDPNPGQPPPGGVDPIPAGTYAFLLDESDVMPGDWHILVGDGSGFDGGLTNTGEYETHLP